MRKSLLWCLAVLCMLLTPAREGFAASQANCPGGAGCAHVAQTGNVHYDTLAEAFQASADHDEIILLKNTSVDAPIEVRTSVTLTLNGKTLENRVANERLFHVYASSFTVNGRNAGSAMVIPADNAASYGFVKVCAPSTVTLDGGTYTGNTDDGAFVKIFERPGISGSGSTIILNNLQATTNYNFFNTDTLSTPESTPTLRVEGGVYKTQGRAFTMDTIPRSPVSFHGVTVTAQSGPVIEASGSAATFEDCDFQVTNTTSSTNFAATAVAVSYNSTAVIKGGTYASTGYGVYVYTSGGTITVEDGVVQGGVAAARADAADNYGTPSTVEIHGGEISGVLVTKTNGNTKADIEVSGGIFDHDVTPNVVPSVARDGAFATLTSGGTTKYYVGTPEKVASDLARTAKENDVIKLQQGSVNLSGFSEHVKVENEGGTLTLDGEPVQQGSTATAHVFGTVWQYDGTNHWYACSTCDAKKDLAAHTSDAGTVTSAGEKTYRCTVCGAVLKTEVISASTYVVPKTGDSSNVPLWLSLMALAAAGMGAAPLLMKKEGWAR